MNKNLSHNMEDYLEAILIIQQEKGNVRVKDIAEKLECSMPSVSSAVKKLHKKGFVNHYRYNFVELTLFGIQVAEKILERHTVLKNFLSEVLGIKAEIAERDACLMEHVISQATFQELKNFMSYKENRVD
ncbi:MAG: metal-dependent transcriptional regulator [bacterium]